MPNRKAFLYTCKATTLAAASGYPLFSAAKGLTVEKHGAL
jgi:hypothetical protein